MRVRGNQSAVPVIGHNLPSAIDNYAPQRSYLLVRIGIDLGGTKIEGLALAGDGREVCRRRITAPRGNYDHTVRAITDLVTEIEAATGERGSVGVGIPGAVSPATGLIKNANSTWLIGKPFERDLSRALNRPVRLANDANCFALSEATDGAAAGAAVVFGVIIGTGTGGGLVVHQQVVVGANAIAGEWGHNPLPAPDEDERPGPQCYCGRRGCIETFLSGPALSRDFAAHGGANLPARTCSPIALTRSYVARRMETPAACAVPPGCGTTAPRLHYNEHHETSSDLCPDNGTFHCGAVLRGRACAGNPQEHLGWRLHGRAGRARCRGLQSGVLGMPWRRLADFQGNWNDLSVGDFFERIRVSMPPSSPGSVTPAQKADIVAHIFNLNKYPAGKTEIVPKTEALKGIKIELKK
jgi:fructokinase